MRNNRSRPKKIENIRKMVVIGNGGWDTRYCPINIPAIVAGAETTSSLYIKGMRESI